MATTVRIFWGSNRSNNNPLYH